MKITIDISQVSYVGTGVARFTEGLIEAILKYNIEHSWTFFYSALRNAPSKTLIEHIKQNHEVVSVPLPPTATTFLWNNLHILPIDNYVKDSDWFISSDWVEPPASSKKATIVHDLVFKRYPETVHPKIKHNMAMRMKWVEKESHVIFTDSEATKKDLVHFYPGIEHNRVITNYPGIETDVEDKKYSLNAEEFSINKPFILAVGKLEPRKNLQRLIEAFEILQRDDILLVIVGPDGWAIPDKKPLRNVIMPGYVEEDQLIAMYQHAEFFIFPSLWEGFGYPLLEAMKYECATAASNRSSLLELAGDASLLFDPENIHSIKDTMETLLRDNDIKQHLINKGKEQVKQFAWKTYYQRLIKTLEQHNV